MIAYLIERKINRECPTRITSADLGQTGWKPLCKPIIKDDKSESPEHCFQYPCNTVFTLEKTSDGSCKRKKCINL